MNWRNVALITISGTVAAACIRLGFWQLERHAERSAIVEEYRRTLAAEPRPFSSAGADVKSADYRPVTISGRYDVGSEAVLINRSRNGAPGVNIITPLFVSGSDTAVLVNRGWVYSPDGSTIDLSRWRAGIQLQDSVRHLSAPVDLRGVEMEFAGNAGLPPLAIDSARPYPRLQNMDLDVIREVLGLPLAGTYMQLTTADTIIREGVPVPLPPPELGQGPHFSYAMQWFAFAAISLVGCAALVRRPGQQVRLRE